MECNQNDSFYPNEEVEKYDEEEIIWRAQSELDDWIEKQRNLDKPAFCNANNQMVQISNQMCVIWFENFSVSPIWSLMYM